MLPPTLKKVGVPTGRSGRFKVERFKVSEAEARSFNAHNFYRGICDREIKAGTYTRLVREPAIRHLQGSSPVVVMSDTPAELSDHVEVVERAHGRCLVNGLGLGVVVQAMLDKPDVSHVTVVESSVDVVKLTGDHYLSMPHNEGRLEIVVSDALSWKPHRGATWDVVWHDIWDNISAENWESMKRLHRRYGRRAGWQGSWCRDSVFRMVEQERGRIADDYWIPDFIVEMAERAAKGR